MHDLCFARVQESYFQVLVLMLIQCYSLLVKIVTYTVRNNYALCIINYAFDDLSGGYCGGVPPLPIPNREVKPACADGTAMQCGRVGGRHF